MSADKHLLRTDEIKFSDSSKFVERDLFGMNPCCESENILLFLR